jgi:NADH-quinone oxidoreductase subunit C
MTQQDDAPRARATPEEALERVRGALGDRARRVTLNLGQVDVVCDASDVIGVMTTLRDEPGLRCRFFTFLSGVDRSEFADDPGGLEVLVHLYSPEEVVHVNVHVPVDAADPRCPSLADVYRGAVWQERECHEMFGVEFEGHPGLTNLYLPEDFEGHPLRRSFKLPSRSVKEWPGAKDPEEAAAGGR